MKYRELIQFNPIDEIIKFEKLDNEDYRTNVVKKLRLFRNLRDLHDSNNL